METKETTNDKKRQEKTKPVKHKYSSSKIYKIVNDDTPDEYVGHTTEQYLSQRFRRHLYDFRMFLKGGKKTSPLLYNLMKRIGVEKFRIELIENYPCGSIDEISKREGHWIRELNATLNKNVAGRVQRERYIMNRDKMLKKNRQYRINNIDKVLAKKKEYRETHKDEINEKAKRYRENNKEKIKERLSQTVNCECGKNIKRSSYYGHIKSKKHLDAAEKEI